jgi:beta-glucosidase/6-phospho-beta-glucosidase/beta-galactosidase
MWGTATAAYQIEGAVHVDGRGDSVWDTFSHIPNKIHNNDNGDIADDSYYQYSKDIKLMKDMGMTAYRFSISWSRILPQGNGEINYIGISHYSKLIDELIRNGIEPLVIMI